MQIGQKAMYHANGKTIIGTIVDTGVEEVSTRQLSFCWANIERSNRDASG